MATQLAETNEAEVIEEAELPTKEAANEAVDNGEGAAAERDYEAEAREGGWMPPEEFKGDKSKCVDAKTFVERKETVMPFLKKERDHWKRKFGDLERTVKQANAFYTKAEERAYERALTDLQARHDEAVEAGDLPGARKVLKELNDLEKPSAPEPEEKADPKEASRKLAEWVDANDWYINDEKKRAYADIQAGAMGPATEWDGGPEAWLDELGKRVNRKFAEQKPNPVNGGGNRSGGARGAKTYSDLPPAAKAQCERFVKQIPGFTKEQYVRDFDWS